MRRPGALSAVLVTAALVVTGCSGSGSAAPANRGQLTSTLLRAGDLPSDWVAKAHDASGDQDTSQDRENNRTIARCIGVPEKVLRDGADDESRTVHSPDFTKGESSVSSDAEPDTGGENGFAAQLAKAILTSPKTSACFEKVLRASLTKSLPGTVRVDSLSVTVTGRRSSDPKNVSFRFDAPIRLSGEGQSLALYITDVQITGHGASASLNFQGSGAPVPAAVQQRAVEAVSARVDKL